MALKTKDEMRARIARILEEANVYDRLRMILVKTKREDIFLRATELLMDRAFGKPSQSHELSGEVKLDIQMVNYAVNDPV